MSDLRKAAEMALEALELGDDISAEQMSDALEALRQALEQPQWVCCVCGEPEALGIVHSADTPCFHYTKREWVGLTDEEVEAWRGNYDFFDSALVREVEAKLKEKNGA